MATAADALAGIAGIEVAALDLMDPASIAAFAAAFVASGRPVHFLINSAGIMAAPLQRDGRGYEAQWSTNHLGHFALAAGLWPALRRAGAGRVVAVSSRGHALAPVDFDDPSFVRRPYDKWQAYGQSKTANALVAVGLDRRAAACGVRAFSVHPGSIYTPLQRFLDDDDYRRVGALGADGQRLTTEQAGFKTVEQGAATALWCATSARLADLGGLHCEDGDVAELVAADATGAGVRPWAADAAAAERLWTLSERLCGLSFDCGTPSAQ